MAENNHNNDVTDKSLLMDDNQLPRNYDSATQARRMSQLRRQQQRSGRFLLTKPPQQQRSTNKLAAGGVLGTLLLDDHGESKENAKTTRTHHYRSHRNSHPQDHNDSNHSVRHHHHHSFLYSMLNPLSHKWQATLFKRFITAVILLDLFCFILSTDPTIGVEANGPFFQFAEGVVSTIFLVEYILRMITITEKSVFGDHGPVLGRLYYAFGTMSAWIDLLATAPFFLERITGFKLPQLTILRIFRLFRILKTESYVRAMDAVYRVIYYNSAILYVATLVCIFLTMVTAVLLYLLRPPVDTEQNFTSITATLYMAVLLLTGQGGPDGDLPWYTKAVILLTSIFSVAMFAIPSSMLTWGFEAEAERMARKAHRRKQQQSGHVNCSDNHSSSSTSDNTTDEEYFALIAGGDDDDAVEFEEQPWMKRVREAFETADENADGTLTLQEARNFFQIGQGSLVDGNDETTATQSRLNSLEAKMDRILRLLEDRQPQTH